MKINAKNERLKRRYYICLKEARQLDEQSVDAVAAAIDRFETHTKQRDFRDFRPEQAVAFKRALAKRTNIRTGERLSKSTTHATAVSLKDFFFWLAGQPGFKARMTYSDADYFKLSLKDSAVAKAEHDQLAPTLDNIRAALFGMPTASPVEKRNQAILAFATVTGARDAAIASTRLKHLDLVEERLFQDGRDMDTKYAKSFPTFFFPVGDDIKAIVVAWVGYLKSELGFGPDDPLFPPSKSAFGVDGTLQSQFDRRCWTSAAPIRAVLQGSV